MERGSNIFVPLATAIFASFAFALPASAAILSSQVVPLTPGWNIVSTPKVLESHSFSAAETSNNFDIYVLDASSPSGWTTMASLGQNEFTPLYGYFVNNKTGTNQSLTFNYLASTTPNQRLFSRTFTTTGWYSLGVADPTLALPIDAATSTDTANPSHILSTIANKFDMLIDFTDGDFAKNVESHSAMDAWKSGIAGSFDSINDFRETKGYAVHISGAGATLTGFQNDSNTVAPPPPPPSPPPPATGTIAVSNATNVQSQNILPNVPNQVLGGFVANAQNEPVTVQQMTFNIATSSTGPGSLALVNLIDENGAVIAGPVDASSDGKHITFNNTITFPTGAHTYTLKGKLPANFANGGTVILSTDPSSQWLGAKGQISGNTVPLASDTLFTMNTMIVRGATLAVSSLPTPSSQNVVAGGQTIILGNVEFDTLTSGEDIRISSVPVFLTEGTAGDAAALNSCSLWNGTTQLTTGSNIRNTMNAGTNVFTLDNSFTIPKGLQGAFVIACNISSAATVGTGHSVQFGVNNSSSFSATGVQSGNALVQGTNLIVTTSNAGVMTFSGGASVSMTIDPSSPLYQVAAGGTTGVTVGVLKIRASNEQFNMTKIGLTGINGIYGAHSTGSGGQSSISGDVLTVHLYNSSGTQIGTATFLSGQTTATSTLNSPFTIPRDIDTLITIKADLSQVGISSTGGTGDLVKVDPLNFEGTGAQSGTTVKGGASGTEAGIRLFKSYPTFALDTLSSTGVADGRLIHFKVTSNASGVTGIGQFNFTLTPTIASVTNAQLFAFTDSAYSQPVSGQATGGQVGSTISTPSGTLSFKPTSPVEIPAGSTYYFELRGSVAGVTTGASIVTKLLGDLSYSGVFPLSGVSGNLIWSGNSTTTSAISNNDWSDGFALPGLPSSGLIQTRSN